jgi:hypothetical protein
VIVADLDLGWRPSYLSPQAGQALGNALVVGSRTIVWSAGAALSGLDVTFSIQAWQAIGGQPALSLEALRLLRRQLKELVENPDLQPSYIQWAATAQPFMPSRSDAEDGWYYISNLNWDPESHIPGQGAMEARMTVARIAPSSPSGLSLGYTGGALSTTYSTPATPLLAYPIGAGQVGPGALSRTGGEGAVPLSAISTPNPLPFVPPVVSALWTGGVRCYDTITTATGGNAPPTSGSFAATNWTQIYGSGHNFAGDLVVTNGLLLLLFRTGQSGLPDVYLWNTQLGPPAWQQVASLQYKDSGLNVGTLRSLDLERVSLQEARVRLRASTSGAQWAELAMELQNGAYDVFPVEFTPLTQANSTGRGLNLILSTAAKVVAGTQAAADAGLSAPISLGPTADTGCATAIGATANQALVGLLWQNAPNSGQPLVQSTTEVGFGETTGPAAGSFRIYGLFAVPYVTAPNLLAEAEAGTLGTGWSSTADGAASAGNTARCASGTASGNAATWGTAFVPTAGVYDLWVRVKLGSLASGTSQMQIGLWNSTDSVFVSSVTWAPNNGALIGGTSYIWVPVAALVTPTATKSMRVRAITTATTTTTWDFDESVLVPRRAATVGQGNFPDDIWSQAMFDRDARWVRG